MTTPRVSVLLPYERTERFSGAVASVLGQTWKDLELIITGAPADAAALLPADSRVRFLATAPTLDAVAGGMLAWQLPGDEWLPVKLEQQVAALDALPDRNAVTCGWLDGRPGAVAYRTSPTAPVPFDETCPLSTWVCRRSALRADAALLSPALSRAGAAAGVDDLLVVRSHRPVTPPLSSAAEPLVSVVIPTYNRARLLRRSIASVLAQTHAALEVLVVDDASTDDTRAVVEAFGDPRVRYFRNPVNRRAGFSRNLAMREARGELLAFLDDDDFWLARKLRQQVRALQAAPADVGLNICGNYSVWPHRAYYVGGPEPWNKMDFTDGFSAKFELIATPGWLLKRDCLKLAGDFDERMRCWDDWELALRLRDVCRFTHLDEPLLAQDRRRLPGTGMSDNKPAFADDIGIIQVKHAPRWAASRRIRARHDKILGLSVLLHRSVQDGRRILWRAFRTDIAALEPLGLVVASLFGRGFVVRARYVVLGLKRLPKRLRRWPRAFT